MIVLQFETPKIIFHFTHVKKDADDVLFSRTTSIHKYVKGWDSSALSSPCWSAVRVYVVQRRVRSNHDIVNDTQLVVSQI